MTPLKRPVKRTTGASVHERGKTRPVVIILEPPSRIGFRLAGTRKTYWLEAAACYHVAVKAEMAAVAREKKQKKTKKRR